MKQTENSLTNRKHPAIPTEELVSLITTPTAPGMSHSATSWSWNSPRMSWKAKHSAQKLVPPGTPVKEGEWQSHNRSTDTSYLFAFESDPLPVLESCNDGKDGWSSPESKDTQVFSLPTPTAACCCPSLGSHTHTGSPSSWALAARNFPFLG